MIPSKIEKPTTSSSTPLPFFYFFEDKRYRNLHAAAEVNSTKFFFQTMDLAKLP
jgi:hypothetical protein